MIFRPFSKNVAIDYTANRSKNYMNYYTKDMAPILYITGTRRYIHSGISEKDFTKIITTAQAKETFSPGLPSETRTTA